MGGIGRFSLVVADLPWFGHGSSPRRAAGGVKKHRVLFSAAEHSHGHHTILLHREGRLLQILAKAKNILKMLQNWSQEGCIFRKTYEKYTHTHRGNILCTR